MSLLDAAVFCPYCDNKANVAYSPGDALYGHTAVVECSHKNGCGARFAVEIYLEQLIRYYGLIDLDPEWQEREADHRDEIDQKRRPL